MNFYAIRRRSLVMGECGALNGFPVTCGQPMSPMSRRRSASPLFSPMASCPGIGSIFERNRQESAFPQTEEEHLLLFHERILSSQEQSLLPLAYDIADWLSSLLGLRLQPSNLMESLQTGVVLCQLAKMIEEKALVNPEIRVKPRFMGRIRYNAVKGSFFSRDNIAMFINFCKELSIHPNLLFETEDLVSHGELRSILICLFEVGRKGSKYGIEPPTLVTLEHQIDREEGGGLSRPPSVATSRSKSPSPYPYFEKESPPRFRAQDASTSTDQNLSDSIDSGLPVEENDVEVLETLEVATPKEEPVMPTELDLKVTEVGIICGKNCSCLEETRRNFRLRKLSEGKYYINGRTVFVRLLKGRFVMVRIGGGWQTLEEFLLRNDPCRSKERRVGGASSSRSFRVTRPASSPPIRGFSRNAGARSSFSACSTPTRSRHASRTSLFN